MDSILSFHSLLFPLVGGYYITTRLEWYKYINQRLDGQAILFNSIIVGIFLLLSTLIITASLSYFFPEFISWLRARLPIKNAYFGTCASSFLIAFFGTRILNLVIDESQAIENAIERIGNELELLFKYSCLESQLILISLTNEKVYIGWVEILPEPQRCPYVRIIPALSGYRTDKHELEITTDYTAIYAQYIKEGKIKAIDELEMNLVIKVEDILTATRFDFEVYERFTLKKANSV